MAEPRVKRLKISRDEDDYRPGNITEIELHNFMTFSDLKCKPGSRLNLVIGPNGSGKSSLVCAIALGLGGEPQLLGRASSVGAYVKRGEESGYVKISLKGYTKEEQLIIMRRIDTRNKTEWLFNGKVVSKKEVLETTKKFNIQVNNLTQFLPQDRVCEFAKLSPLQLLEETEKAIGDPQLPVQHSALVEKSKNLKKLEQTVKQITESLNQQKALNAEQEKDVKRVRQRQKLLEKAESMKKKLPWLKYDMKKAGYMETKEKEINAKKKLDEAAKNLNYLREPIEKQKIEKALQDTKSKKVMNLINQNVSKRLELIESENNLGVQVQGKYREMEDLKRQEEDYKQRLLKANEDLAAAEHELVNLPFYEPPKEKIESLGAQILELQISVNQKMLQKSECEKLLVQKRVSLRQCVDRLKDMENTHSKLLNALRNSGADRIYEAYNWLKEHRHELNKEVYGPVLIEVNVSNRSHANYLEGHVPYYAWKSFITQDPRDRDILVKNMKSFDVPVLNYVGSDGHHKAPFQVSEEMRLLGIQSRLDQVFNAPSAVKEVLVGQFGLDHSYVGSKEADHRANEVSKLGIMDFWTPENHYRWSTSRYGGHISGSVDSVSNSHLLMCSSDVGEIEKLRSKKNELDESINGLEDTFKSIQTDQRHLDDEMANLHKEREEIINTVQFEKKKRKELENRVNLRKKRLQSIEHEDDLDTTMARLVDQAAKYNAQRFQCAIKIKKLLIENVAHRHSFAEKHMSSIEFDAKIREMESNLKQHEKLALQISMDFENCKKDVEDYKRLLLAAKRHAESIAIITPELEKAFLEMPATIEELEAAIQDITTQANSILFLNQNILEEYEQRQRKIQALTTSLEANENELRSYLTETDALKESWLPKLRDLVAQINETFSRNFQDMAVAGEVSLDEHGMDFGDYGILIKVKFRQAGQLQVLSAHHQSGGERSVSTILYLVSLQDLTNCPFRVVDEINQGMDPINERKMFQQLVRAASQLNTPQCFLLTPKLLPDLEYSEACSILNIMNGPWIEQPSKVWSNGDSFGTILGLVDKNQC